VERVLGKFKIKCSISHPVMNGFLRDNISMYLKFSPTFSDRSEVILNFLKSRLIILLQKAYQPYAEFILRTLMHKDGSTVLN